MVFDLAAQRKSGGSTGSAAHAHAAKASSIRLGSVLLLTSPWMPAGF